MTSRGTKYWSAGSIPLIGPEILGSIIAAASDLSIVISDEGTVLTVMVDPQQQKLNKANFENIKQWEHNNIRDFLTPESIPKLDAKLEHIAQGEADHRHVELNHIDGREWEFPMRYTFHPISPDGSILLIGQDMRSMAEMQQKLVKAQIALERDYELQRRSEARLRAVMAASRDAIVFLAADTGIVTEANDAAATLLDRSRDKLIGKSLALEVETTNDADLLNTLIGAAMGDDTRQVTMRARHCDLTVSITPKMVRTAGDHTLLCRMEPADQEAARSDLLRENLSSLYREGADCIVFTDAKGTLYSANDSFLNMLETNNHAQIKGRKLSDFLSRGSVDLKMLIENTQKTRQLRSYSTSIVSEHGAQTPVEIAATLISGETVQIYGFVMRRTQQRDDLAKPSIGMDDTSVRAVIGLVGSTRLKKIVSKTTDVIEKMCIETALELTQNNRVAAADMLGLSRQSLYVKLRKYGLL